MGVISPTCTMRNEATCVSVLIEESDAVSFKTPELSVKEDASEITNGAL